MKRDQKGSSLKCLNYFYLSHSPRRQDDSSINEFIKLPWGTQDVTKYSISNLQNFFSLHLFLKYMCLLKLSEIERSRQSNSAFFGLVAAHLDQKMHVCSWFWHSKTLEKYTFSRIKKTYIKKECSHMFRVCWDNLCTCVWSETYFFSRFPAPVSLNPLANGLWSILSWVI